MQVKVDKDLDSALKLLKKKLVKEGVFKEIKARKHYEKQRKHKHKSGVVVCFSNLHCCW